MADGRGNESSACASARDAVVTLRRGDVLGRHVRLANEQSTRLDFSAVTPPSLGTCSFKELPRAVFSYILKTSWRHRLPLCLLTAVVFLMDVVPLELQRRVVNDLVKHRAFGLVVILGIVYSGVVVVQGGIKLTLNVYRGWVGERAKRELRRRIHAVTDVSAGSPAAEAEGIAVAMVVAEVEALGGFVGESIPEPLL